MSRGLERVFHGAGIVGQHAQIGDPAAQAFEEVAQHPAIGIPDLPGKEYGPGIANFVAGREQADLQPPENGKCCVAQRGRQRDLRRPKPAPGP